MNTYKRFNFVVVKQRIPVWWRWYYWGNPVAWTLYGLVISQYGDDNKVVRLSEGDKFKTTRQVLNDVFGYRNDFFGVVVVVVAGFCTLFAVIFAFAIKFFRFQRR